MPCFGVPRRGWKSQMLSKHLPVTEFVWPFILVLQSSRYWQYNLGTAEHKHTPQPFSWQNGWATGEMTREWKKLPPPNLNSKFGEHCVCVQENAPEILISYMAFAIAKSRPSISFAAANANIWPRFLLQHNAVMQASRSFTVKEFMVAIEGRYLF